MPFSGCGNDFAQIDLVMLLFGKYSVTRYFQVLKPSYDLDLKFMKIKLTSALFLCLLLLLAGCGPVDPRYELFSADADKLGSIGLHEDTDTLALELADLFEESTNPKLHPEEFS